MRYSSFNPYTEEQVTSFACNNDTEVGEALEHAVNMFRGWKTQSFDFRSQLFLKLSSLIENRLSPLASLITQEIGKPITQAIDEVEKCVLCCRFFAEHAESMLHQVPCSTDAAQAYVRYDPLGPILAVMPWNYPFWQVFRVAVPTMMAGNVVVLKHAPNTPRVALAIESLFIEAGFPEGCFQSLFLTNQQVAALIEEPRLRGVALTGSVRAGREVAARVGASLKPMLMGLGGSDAFIVCEDADLELAIEVGVQSKLINSGQTCLAAKRFLIHKSLYNEFLNGFTKRLEDIAIGDPLNKETQVGPMAREDLRNALIEQVSRAKELGARIEYEYKLNEDKGYFFPPSVLTGVSPSNPVWQEELFGPVSIIRPFKDDAEAVTLSNDSPYGLAATVWTNSEKRIKSFPENLDVGCVFINDLVKRDLRLPFGGTKCSGFGRELAKEGLLEFVNVKTVVVR